MSFHQDALHTEARTEGRSSTGMLAALATPSIVAGCVFLFVANLLLWANSTVLDEEEFSTTIAEVLERDHVQERLGQVLAQQALQNSDLEVRLREELPPRLLFVSPLIEGQLETLLAAVAQRVLASDLAGDVQQQILRALHQRLLALFEDDRALGAQGNDLVLNLEALYERFFEAIGVAPPQRLEGRARGEVVLVENIPGLGLVSWLIDNREELLLAILTVGLLLVAAGVFFKANRTDGFRVVGFGAVAIGVLTLLILLISNLALEQLFEQRTVSREMVKALESNLRWQSLGFIILGACLIALTDARIRGQIDAFETRARSQMATFRPATVALVGAGLAAAALLVVG